MSSNFGEAFEQVRAASRVVSRKFVELIFFGSWNENCWRIDTHNSRNQSECSMYVPYGNLPELCTAFSAVLRRDFLVKYL